ncbi:hypothetical protein EON83_23675 [bacterium]|nr:MAG: hypothetical protein EON83_23675 [bacterium]
MNQFTSRQMIAVCVLSMGAGALFGPPLRGAAQPPETSSGGVETPQPLATPAPSNSDRTTRAVGTITGQGTTGRISKFTGPNAIGNSVLFENGGKVGLGTTTPSGMFTANSTTNNVAAITGSHSNLGIGVFGQSANSDGVLGHSSSGAGVRGRHIIGTGTAPGVSGETNSTSADAKGVQGIVQSTSPGANSAGVRGINNGTESLGVGVYGSHAGSGSGVYGTSSNGYGVHGISSNGNGVVGQGYVGVLGLANNTAGSYAAAFTGSVVVAGNLTVTGNISKGSGSFKIDHPQHPATEYLSHSFVESPDMMNVYNGNAKLNSQGEAVVKLPGYFQSLNREFRYQLTCIGAPALVYVAQEIHDNQFKIAGGKAGMKVSWQVTGIRNDVYARQNRIRAEENKIGNDRGKYLYPAGFGFGKDKQIGPNMPRLAKR